MMEDLRKTVSLVLVTAFVMATVVTGDTMLYVGGGKETWRPGVNLTEWCSRQHFYVKNWLYFGYDPKMFSVFEVNKTGYDNCNTEGFIRNITKGGRDVFQLLEPRTYYFISGGGFCFGGMKVAINVEELSPAPAPASAKSASPTTPRGWIALPVVLATTALAWIF